MLSFGSGFLEDLFVAKEYIQVVEYGVLIVFC